MNPLGILAVAIASSAMALAESAPPRGPQAGESVPPYQPAVPAPSVNAYGGWSGYGGGGSTVAGSALNGMASVVSAKGDYNLSTSAAAVNMTQAQRNEIQNRQQWTNTYFEMQATNRAAREAAAGPKPTMEQLVRRAHDGMPQPISPSQMDPVSGKIDWPVTLQDDRYGAQRAVMEQLAAKRARYGALGLSDQTKAHQTVDAMYAGLKAQIREIPPPDYIASRGFLRSLNYFTTKTELD